MDTTTKIDVFNGDADGICALHQYRLVHPSASRLVTGVKRDIQLLKQLDDVSKAEILALDISFEKNRDSAVNLLERGCKILYFDHHFAGDIPDHPNIETHIDPSPKVCTSLLMDQYLGGVHRAWAVAAAFGDNLIESAQTAADPLNLSSDQLGELRTLGELLNYNGYGASLDDLHFAPAALYNAVKPYSDPFEFFRKAPQAAHLREGFDSDMKNAERLDPIMDSSAGRVFRFPGERWARRAMGVFSNQMANDDKDRAISTIVDNSDGSLRISVRAPKNRPKGADDLCRSFPTGGGRAGAAGVNELPLADLQKFLDAFQAAFEV